MALHFTWDFCNTEFLEFSTYFFVSSAGTKSKDTNNTYRYVRTYERTHLSTRRSFNDTARLHGCDACSSRVRPNITDVKNVLRVFSPLQIDFSLFPSSCLFTFEISLTGGGDHRNRNTKEGKAGCWQARLTDCVLGNAVTCQLGDNPKKGDLKLVHASAALVEIFYLW